MNDTTLLLLGGVALALFFVWYNSPKQELERAIREANLPIALPPLA